MVQLDDGGKNGSVTVSNTNRLDVSSRVADRTYYESRDEGQVYTAPVQDVGAVADEITAWIKNTSTTKDMIIDTITIGTDVLSTWHIKFASFTTQPTGTLITATNINKASSNTASSEIRGGAGGVANVVQGDEITFLNVAAGGQSIFDSKEALRLGQDDQLAVECKTNSAALITIEFHFDSE